MANLFFTDDIQLSHQKSLLKILKHNKSLQALKLQNQSPRTFSLSILLPQLKNLRTLSNFTLGLADTQFITSEICHSFAISVKNLKQLSHLNHNIYQNLQNSSKSLTTFQHFLLLRHLSNLSLNFNSTKTFTEISFCLFSHNLSQIRSLTSFSINLNSCERLSKTGLSLLFSNLGKLSSLTAVSLQFMKAKHLDSDVIIELFLNLKNLLALQELALSFSLCEIPKISTQEPLAAGLSIINSLLLHKLSLDFYSNFSDSHLSNLLGTIQRFSVLTHLELGFNPNSQITGQGLSNLHETLASFPLLTHFAFMESTFSRMDANLVLNSLSLPLGNSKHLQSLKIMIYSNGNLDNSAVQKFSTKLAQLSQLKYLDLDFEECQKLSDKSLESIAFTLQSLENLESLHLNFEMIDKITNQGVITLGSSLAHLKGLKDLQLKLGNKENGESLGSLVTSLRGLNCLNELYLNFGECIEDGSGSESYKDFIEVVGRLEMLKKICLVIPQFEESQYCDEIVRNSSKDFTIFWK